MLFFHLLYFIRTTSRTSIEFSSLLLRFELQNRDTFTYEKTFGYVMYSNGNNIGLIQKMLNHSSPEITLAYIGITRDDMNRAILSID